MRMLKTASLRSFREQNGKLVALSGRELEIISDAELPEVADRTAVFALIRPDTPPQPHLP
jgi:hypothetical protein